MRETAVSEGEAGEEEEEEETREAREWIDPERRERERAMMMVFFFPSNNNTSRGVLLNTTYNFVRCPSPPGRRARSSLGLGEIDAVAYPRGFLRGGEVDPDAEREDVRAGDDEHRELQRPKLGEGELPERHLTR